MNPRRPNSEAVSMLALTGFMAAGKSTIGRGLSGLLRWQFIDLDCEIERRCGCPIHEIFNTHGEAHFRAVEAETLRATIDVLNLPTVIALGGGTFVQPENAEILRQRGVRVVFLELGVDKLLQRCRTAGERNEQNPRPLSADEAAFFALYRQRLPFYRSADLTVNTYNRTPEQVARRIAVAFRLLAAAESM